VIDELAGRRTLLDAIRDRLAPATIRHARGCGIQGGTDAEIAEAVAAVAASDVAVMFLGERSGLTTDSTTGEFRDRREIGFAGRQQELLEAVVATGTPVVLVVVSGRPLAIEWAARHCAAVVLAWVPGDEGPDVVAEILAGDVVPGGKLPVSIPRHVGQVPITYRHHPSGGRSNPKGDYVDGPTSPLWPFGFGRSYTTFELSNLRLDRVSLPTEGGEIALSVEVANTGARSGDEVVQLYVRDEEASVARPVRELRGFRRVHLVPSERRTVTFRLSAEQFAYVGADYRRVIEPGTLRLAVGTSSIDLSLGASVELVGPVVELRQRYRYLTETSVTAPDAGI
jgi:beta-glucosidase